MYNIIIFKLCISYIPNDALKNERRNEVVYRDIIVEIFDISPTTRVGKAPGSRNANAFGFSAATSRYFTEISGDVGDVVAAITVPHACLSLCDGSAAGTDGELRKVTYRRRPPWRRGTMCLPRAARNRGLISRRKGP